MRYLISYGMEIVIIVGTLHKKWSFSLRISSVNVTTSAVSLKKSLMENFIFCAAIEAYFLLWLWGKMIFVFTIQKRNKEDFLGLCQLSLQVTNYIIQPLHFHCLCLVEVPELTETEFWNMNTWLAVFAFSSFISQVSSQQVGEMANCIQKLTK